MAGILVERATAVVIRTDRVLLIQDRTYGAYMMPGSRVGPAEDHSDTVVRGLFEQTGLSTINALHLFNWESSTNRHSVFRIETTGEVQIGTGIPPVLWWDRQEDLRLFAHVNAILFRLATYE